MNSNPDKKSRADRHVSADLEPEQKVQAQELADESDLSLADWLRAVCGSAISKQVIILFEPREMYLQPDGSIGPEPAVRAA